MSSEPFDVMKTTMSHAAADFYRTSDESHLTEIQVHPLRKRVSREGRESRAVIELVLWLHFDLA